MQTHAELIIDRIWSPTKQNHILRNVLLTLAGIVALIISAKIKIHFDLIAPPFTMQTAVVLFLGAAMGWRLGSSAVFAYLLLGMIGQPVFTDTPEKGIGIAYMMGPTGGYLFGFLVVSTAIGYFAEKGMFRQIYTIFPLLLMGAFGILFFGFLYLGGLLGSYQKAWMFGVLPFIGIEVVKVTLVSTLLVALGYIKSKPSAE